MNNQSEINSDEPLKNKFINGAWIDVKLYTLKATKRQQNSSVINPKKDQKIIEEENMSSTTFYNELHYGNYE